jgi:hypothetical protein
LGEISAKLLLLSLIPKFSRRNSFWILQAKEALSFQDKEAILSTSFF